MGGEIEVFVGGELVVVDMKVEEEIVMQVWVDLILMVTEIMGFYGAGGSMQKNRTEDDLDDITASSYKKSGTNVDDRTSIDFGTKRRLALEYNNPTAEDNDGNSTLPMITDEPSSPQPQVEDSDIERSKRSKKARADSPSLGSAGSHEESVRSE
jgi:hypothetical protein